jgi:molybdenum cofactor synthesis domain-containing protein
MEKGMNVAVITVSTRSAAGEREDTSGPAICALVEETIGKIVHYAVVSDDQSAIRGELIRVCDEVGADIAFTLGGTGLAPSDVTPESTMAVIERAVPGISETIRAQSLEKTNRAMLSRGVAGVRRHTLIINMPGSEKAARESFDIVMPVLGHAVELIHGSVKDCGRPAEKG